MAPDINLLKHISQQNLSTALRVIAGYKKILIIEAKLTQTLDLIANYQFLTNHGVAKVFHLESCTPPHSIDTKDCDNTIIYLISSNLISAKHVCDQINYNLLHNSNREIKYGVVVIPRNLYIISQLFESEGVYGHVVFSQYNYELIALDEHILSLEYENIPSDLWLASDSSFLCPIAKVLFNLRGIYGEFHHLIALGSYSESIVKQMNELEYIYQNSLRSHFRPTTDLPTVIIMDRSLDYLTPLLLPLTYEGLLDEIFEIKGKTVTFDSTVTGSADTAKKLKHTLTSSSDTIFQQIRNTHFSSVVKQLVGVGADLKRQREGTSCLPVSAMKSFVEKDLKKIALLQKNVCLHLGVLDVIIKERATELKQIMDIESNIFDGVQFKEVLSFLEDSMAKDMEFITVLRLLCIITLVQDGIRDYKSLKLQFIQSYGFKQVITLNNLEKMGLVYGYRGIDVSPSGVVQALARVKPGAGSGSGGTGGGHGSPGTTGSGSSKSGSVPFQTVIKKLIPPANEIKGDVPDLHASYVFNGKFTPLVTKITEEILSALFNNNNNAKRKSSSSSGSVGGSGAAVSTMIEKKLDDILKFYHIPAHAVKIKSSSSPTSPPSGSIDPFSRGRNVLVFIIGGMSRAEIATLQLISRKLECNILAGGTNITNGRKLLKSLIAS